MEGDKDRFTTQMRNATKSTSPPGGSTRRNGMDQFSTTSKMSTPPPDEEPDEDATLKQILKDLVNATDKYEAAIAMQPEANRPFNTQVTKQLDHHSNKNPNPNTSANQAGWW